MPMASLNRDVVGWKNAVSLDNLLFIVQDRDEEENSETYIAKCVAAFKKLLESGEAEFVTTDSEEVRGIWDTPPGDYD